MTDIDPTSFDRFEFTPAYDVEVDPEFPADGSWRCAVYAFEATLTPEAGVRDTTERRRGSPGTPGQVVTS